MAVSAQEYHPLLLQQPDCGKQKLYPGIPQKAADGVVYTSGVGAYMVDKEDGKIDVDRANESAG